MDDDNARFKVGATYTARSLTDHTFVWRFTVLDRTNKFITLGGEHGGGKRVGVRIWDGVEVASPLGRYSMSPTIRADRTEA